ncbi:YitT family protein [Allobaculum stercoricanis]|uniref:YitT family protein n=1 Tax=Allobaculum stercoricanis TaxID=174709 RepID=UPI00037D6427|nr:YitT family protein [Allobaculum stercoricanis]
MNKNNEFVHTLRQYTILVVGSTLFSMGVTFFVVPWQLNTGGLIGIAQIISYTLIDGASLSGVINVLFNIPLFILAWRSLSKNFVFKTLLSLGIQSALLSLLPVPKTPILNDELSCVIIGAVIAGVGIGLCLQAAGSAGGLDILGMYFSYTKPGFSVGKISYIVNVFVEIAAVFMFGLPNALYSTLFLVITYFISDKVHLQNIVMYGLIVTSKKEVKEHILHDLHRGVTAWQGYGAYTNSGKEILFCVMNSYEVKAVKRIVRTYDPQAYFIVSKGRAELGNFERRLME